MISAILSHFSLERECSVSLIRVLVLAVPLALTLSACEKNLLSVTRSSCPALAIPNYVGETTLFAPADSRDASAIDVTASIINLRGNCSDGADKLVTTVNFDVVALRRNGGAARTVVLPFFASVVQGGNVIVSKQLSTVTLNFAAGQMRAQAAGAAQSHVARSATVLPLAIQKLIARKRKAGDLDAATDPLADPEVKAAIRATSFEILVGFQLDDDALAYNVTK